MAHLTSPSAIVNRSNTDLANIEMILEDRDLSVLLRMALIEEIMEGWKANVGPIRARSTSLTVASYFKARAERGAA